MRAHINITKKSTPVLMSIVNRIYRFSHWNAGSICASKHQSWPIYDKLFSRQEIMDLESALSSKIDPDDIHAIEDLLFNDNSSHKVSIKKTIYFNAAIDNVLNKFVDYVCADKSIDVNRKEKRVYVVMGSRADVETFLVGIFQTKESAIDAAKNEVNSVILGMNLQP